MKTVLLCLHGWGGSKESFTELREALNQSLRSDSGQALKGSDLKILTPDLPGFGSEPDPKEPWTTDDYADWVVRWLKKQPEYSQLTAQDSQLLLLGHSHGGRIAINLVAKNKLYPKHLYLCAAAGIRHPRHIKRIIGLTLAKTGKSLLKIRGLRSLQPLGKKLLYRLVRVHDYEQASNVMKDTLRKVSAEDARPLLSSIKIPTDIFWGEQDGMTPFSDALLMHAEIKGSHLHRYPGIRHRVHRDKAEEIAAIITRLL